jgi:hypothetical protein
MKRRRLDPESLFSADDENAQLGALPITRPTEGTLVVDIGNSTNTFSSPAFGNTPNIPLSGVLSDITTIQYDEFFSMNDQYTFSPQNSIIGLAVLVYADPAAINPLPPLIKGRYGLWLIPVVLPWKKLSFGDLSNNPDDPEVAGTNLEGRDILHRLQDQLVYALNLMWFKSSTPAGGAQPNQANIPSGNGWVLSKELFNQIDHPDFLHPMWTDEHTTDPLSLIWFRGPNGELGIKRNGSFNDGTFWGSLRFSMNFITIPKSFLQSHNFYRRTLNPILNPVYVETCPGPSSVDAMLDNENGWIGGGPYVFGIGNFNTTNCRYVDDYFNNPTARSLLFNSTTYAHQDTTTGYPTLADYTAYRAFAASILLNEEIVMGPRIASLVASRFFIVTSQALTRNQRIRYEGNNPVATSGDIIGIVYPPSSLQNALEETNTLTNYIDPFEGNTNAVLHTDPTDPKQTIDISIEDELHRPFKNANASNLKESFYLFGNGQRRFYPPNSFNGALHSIPAAITILNPDPVTYPDGDCLLVAQHLSQLAFFMTYVESTDPTKAYNIASTNFNITCSEASWMTHFVRLFGRS